MELQGLPVPWIPRPGKAHLVLSPQAADTAGVFPPVDRVARTRLVELSTPQFVWKTSNLNVRRDSGFVFT